MIQKRIFLLAFCLGASPLLAQEDLSVFKYWNYYENTPSVSLYKHLAGKAFAQIARRNDAVSKLHTKAGWQKRQVEMRIKLARAVGAFPEKTPLNPVITGTIKQDDFTVEKLYFESRPGFHVTAALFMPDKKADRLPAILFCSGHSENGFRSAVYQRIIINYVKKGFVVLAFDPIGQGERKQYAGSEIKMGPVDEHSYPGAQSFISGLSPANYFIWDGIRAIDYLISRKEVDPARIGITGRSGGGTQSAYIAAMDDRILAAAPECYITTFDKLLRSKGPQDGEQNLLYGLESGIDIADFLEVRAPKPALIVSTTRDIFSIQGARDVYDEVQKAYTSFGKAVDISMTEDDAGHASTPKNREAAYAFFQKYLRNPGSPRDIDVKVFTDQELSVTPNGQILPFLNGESLFSLNQKFTAGVIAKRQQHRKANPDYLKTLREKVIAISGYENPSGRSDVVLSGRISRIGYDIDKYLVKGSGDYYLSVLWLIPKVLSGKTILLLDDEGKSSAAKLGGLADKLAGQGFEVILPDLSGIGELSPGFIRDGDSVIEDVPLNLWFTGILTHKSLVAVRAEEIAILNAFIKRTTTRIAGKISVVASGVLTSDLLHAAAISNSFEKLALINPLFSYWQLSAAKFYQTRLILSAVAASMPTYDLPDLLELAGKERVIFINPVDGSGRQVDQIAYAGGGVNFKVKARLEDFPTILANWLR